MGSVHETDRVGTLFDYVLAKRFRNTQFDVVKKFVVPAGFVGGRRKHF